VCYGIYKAEAKACSRMRVLRKDRVVGAILGNIQGGGGCWCKDRGGCAMLGGIYKAVAKACSRVMVWRKDRGVEAMMGACTGRW
jgi:hypothetical protein